MENLNSENMNYVKHFSNYCDTVVASKKIDIPERRLPQSVRQLQFEESCKLMRYNLEKNFIKKAKEVETQAHNEGKDLTMDDQKQIWQIGKSKIDQFIEKAKDDFYKI